jgi:hypothetical protein
MSTLLTCTSSTRPGSPAAGDTLFETDTNKVIVYSGTAWKEYEDNGQLYNDSDITALSPHIWLDGAGGYFYDDDLKSNLVSDDGEYVGAWADRSGNGFDFTQSLTVGKPRILKNFGAKNATVLSYSAEQLIFTGTASSQISGAGSTMFFVLYNSMTTGDYILTSSDSSTRIKSTQNTSSGDYYFNAQNYAGTASSNSYLRTDLGTEQLLFKLSIYAIRMGSSLGESFVNGTTQLVTTTTVPTGTLFTSGVNYDLLDSTVAVDSPNLLGEFIVFDSALSDTNMNTVTNYLGKKYSITVSTL